MDIPEYFNNVVLAQFKATGIPLKVYVNGEYLIITDMYEISDPLIGSGMDEDGNMNQFDYREIDHLLVGGNVIDLATYTKAMAGDTPEQDAKKDEEPKEESIQELTKKEQDLELKSLKLKMDAAKEAMAAAKDKMNQVKKQPTEEAVMEGLDETNYTFGVGDIVKNKNTSCPHYGSMGIVQKIMKLANDMGMAVKYRVVNSGPTYKPGDVLTKTVDQLEPTGDIDEVNVRKVHGDRKVKNPDTGKDIKLSSALKAKKGTKVYNRARKIYKSLKDDK